MFYNSWRNVDFNVNQTRIELPVANARHGEDLANHTARHCQISLASLTYSMLKSSGTAVQQDTLSARGSSVGLEDVRSR